MLDDNSHNIQFPDTKMGVAMKTIETLINMSNGKMKKKMNA